MDLSQFLLTMNNRLEQAEAQLASKQSACSNLPSTALWDDMQTDGDPKTTSLLTFSSSLNPLASASTGAYTHGSTGESSQQLHFPHHNGRPAASDEGTERTVEASPFDWTEFRIETCPADSISDFAALDMLQMGQKTSDSPADLDLLFTSYDDVLGDEDELTSPLMERLRHRFRMEISLPSPPEEVRLLAYAIATLSTSTIPELRRHVNTYYEKARNLLEACERRESLKSLTNVSALQACISLMVYEFKCLSPALAWMTLGRAVRLTKIMELDSIDSNCNCVQEPDTQADTQAAAALSLAITTELDEKRFALWLLNMFDALANLKAISVSTLDQAVQRPFSSLIEGFARAGHIMSLQQIFEISDETTPSALGSVMLMISLYKCLQNHTQLLRGVKHAFWETHFTMARAVSHCQNSVLTPRVLGCKPDDPLFLTLRVNMDAIDICLHNIALDKVKNERLAAGVIVESISRCISATNSIVEAIQLAQALCGSRLVALKQLDYFLVWPINTAIHFCFRMLRLGEGDVDNYIKSLRILSTVMRDFIDADHVDSALLAQADDKIAHVDR
ncbi:hypothetical protein QQS21_005421 [Conoideocrella luteorostrata]|uniref:Transcription factor domain-containing protein n=1 Tax=Conoideocrella luteorostrata TaxID=1105319 RepID=A0AAJ0CRW9_9HYPO|nr:hypothetical protein QQS21_005421 [Conoideocrella luteorostrata]